MLIEFETARTSCRPRATHNLAPVRHNRDWFGTGRSNHHQARAVNVLPRESKLRQKVRMSGRHEEESDKVSMGEWGIWWESRRLVSQGHTKMCSPMSGISVAVRTEERHEVSKKVGMRIGGYAQS